MASEQPSGTGGVLVGLVGRAHGLSGHVIVHPETDNPRRFEPGAVVRLGDRVLRVASSSRGEAGIRVRFEGVDDRTSAEALRGAELRIDDHDRRPLRRDEYWPDDLIGLRVLDATGQEVGTVTAVAEGPAQDRLVIAGPHGEAEVPFVAELVPHVDVEQGLLRLGAVEGLFREP